MVREQSPLKGYIGLELEPGVYEIYVGKNVEEIFLSGKSPLIAPAGE